MTIESRTLYLKRHWGEVRKITPNSQFFGRKIPYVGFGRLDTTIVTVINPNEISIQPATVGFGTVEDMGDAPNNEYTGEPKILTGEEINHEELVQEHALSKTIYRWIQNS